MFDFPYNDCRFVSMADIDVTQKNVENNINILLRFFNSYPMSILKEIYLCGIGDVKITMKSHKYIYNIENEQVFIPYISMDRFSGVKKIDRQLLINFMKNAAKTNMRYGKYNIYELSTSQMVKKCKENICFGIDEYFANKVVIQSLIRNKNPVMIYTTINAMYLLYRRNISAYTPLLKKYINFTLKNKKSIVNKSLLDKQRYLDSLFYEDDGKIKETTEITQEHKDIIKAIYILLKQISIQRDYREFTRDIISIYLSPSMIGHGKIIKLIKYSIPENKTAINDDNIKHDDILTSINIDLDVEKYSNAREPNMRIFDIQDSYF